MRHCSLRMSLPRIGWQSHAQREACDTGHPRIFALLFSPDASAVLSPRALLHPREVEVRLGEATPEGDGVRHGQGHVAVQHQGEPLADLLAGLGERAAVACHGLGVEGWLLGSEAQQPWIARLRGECAHGMGGHVCTQESGACARCACSGGTMPRGLASMPQYFQV